MIQITDYEIVKSPTNSKKPSNNYCVRIPSTTPPEVVESINSAIFSVIKEGLKLSYLSNDEPVHEVLLADVSKPVLVELYKEKVLLVDEGGEDDGLSIIAVNKRITDRT